MNITCISDTHGAEPTLEGGDLLIHAGDLTFRGRLEETITQLDYLASYKTEYNDIVIVPGNHEVDWESGKVPFRRLCEERGITVLIDDSIIIDGVKIYGTPTTPVFGNWAYMRGPSSIASAWDCIPEDVDILITHGPPKGILDVNVSGISCGCPSLLLRVRDIKPKLHVFGHIHESHGRLDSFGTTFVNASIMTKDYLPYQDPTVIQYKR